MIPNPLIDDIASGKCLPFIGAGFSLNAKLPDSSIMPDWPALTLILAEASGINIKNGGPTVASAYEKMFGRVQLIETIRHALHTDVVEPGNAHRQFAQLPFDTIYTTNFDLLLEDAYSNIRRPFRSLVGELQLPFHGGPLTTNIVKMHGDLRHEEHMVITQDDYETFLNGYPVISTHLSAMLITRTALFIGYSLSDPHFNQIREIVKSRLGRFQRMSYIVQFNQPKSKIDKMLEEGLHVLNLKTSKKQSFDDKLADFFRTIQDELDARAGTKLRNSKPEMFEDVSKETLEATSRAPDASTLLMSSSNLCFILMPFGEPFDILYREIIKPAVIDSGLKPVRADEIYSPGSIMEQIRSAIQQSRACIADLTGRNPNVLYELGIAQTLGKPTVMLAQDLQDVPFDLKQYRIISYDKNALSLKNLRNDLQNAISSVLGRDRLDEAKSLIANGMFRAAVAMLGVLLEHSLHHILSISELLDIRIKEPISRTLSMGKMIEILRKAEIIPIEEQRKLREATMIRNRAVHDLKEPTIDQANMMFDYVATFIENYIKNAEQQH